MNFLNFKKYKKISNLAGSLIVEDGAHKFNAESALFGKLNGFFLKKNINFY